MKKIILTLFMLAIPALANALAVPALQSRVNDLAGLLSPEASRRIEAELAEFERAESTQIVVLTISTLEGEALEEYSIKVAEAWKIGQEGKGNGVILLVARQERKVRIEVGRGLEGTLTDLVSGRIIRNAITPRFKTGDFDGGVIAGTNAIMAVVKGEYKPDDRIGQQTGKDAPPITTFLIFLLVACVVLGSLSKVLGGLAGAVGLPLSAAIAFPGLALVVIGLLVVVGFFGGILLAFLFGGGRGPGIGGPFWGGGFGGGFGGGSFGGDGGGFSGGGGDFGGGGASGDW